MNAPKNLETLAKCPVPGCPNAVQPGRMMCTPHWNRVPTQIIDMIRTCDRSLEEGEQGAIGELSEQREYYWRRALDEAANAEAVAR